MNWCNRLERATEAAQAQLEASRPKLRRATGLPLHVVDVRRLVDLCAWGCHRPTLEATQTAMVKRGTEAMSAPSRHFVGRAVCPCVALPSSPLKEIGVVGALLLQGGGASRGRRPLG